MCRSRYCPPLTGVIHTGNNERQKATTSTTTATTTANLGGSGRGRRKREMPTKRKPGPIARSACLALQHSIIIADNMSPKGDDNWSTTTSRRGVPPSSASFLVVHGSVVCNYCRVLAACSDRTTHTYTCNTACTYCRGAWARPFRGGVHLGRGE